MSHHSLACTVTRLKKTVDRMEEGEKMVDRKFAEVQRKGENMMGRKASILGQIDCGNR